MSGSLILLFLIVATFLAAFIQTGASSTSSVPGCTTSNNATECNDVGATSFVRTLRNVAVGDIEGAPVFVSALWIIIGGFLLVVGILLIASNFIPFTAG